MIILTDADGCLVDWVSIFKEWMAGMGKFPVKGLSSTSYEIDEMYGIGREAADDYVKFFNMSAEIEYLPPLRDSIKYIEKMHKEHGVVFHCITALGPNKKSHVLRERNLKNLFGETTFREIDCTASGEEKFPILEKYRYTGTVWIEDNVKRAIEGYELGLDTYLMNHIYNRGDDIPSDIKRVYNWKELYENIFG
tara:strand:- start:7745 stop:8326 length:582 start_codon:yes stop_codon:yes gene_type:complete